MPKPLRNTGRQPLWKGPQEDGITTSLLSKFLVCRDRFYLKVVEGLGEDEGFRHALEYGSLWHEAEEAHAGRKDWHKPLAAYATKLLDTYPGNEKTIQKWFAIAKVQFPLYVAHWRNHVSSMGRTPILQEEAFRVRYALPSGRWVMLRGKFDSVFGQSRGIWLQENKTKGEIDEEGIQKGIQYNLQTMIYHVALRLLSKERKDLQKHPIQGTLYNVVRRPLSDRFAIRQKKKESDQAFYNRIAASIKAKPDHFFKRWKVILQNRDVDQFRLQTLDPILEALCDWWDFIKEDPFNPWRVRHSNGIPGGGVHYRYPFGVYNSLSGGFRGDFFDFLTTGNRRGLVKVPSLFPELEHP